MDLIRKQEEREKEKEVSYSLKLNDAGAYDSDDEPGQENLGVVRLIIQYVYNKGKLLADE